MTAPGKPRLSEGRVDHARRSPPTGGAAQGVVAVRAGHTGRWPVRRRGRGPTRSPWAGSGPACSTATWPTPTTPGWPPLGALGRRVDPGEQGSRTAGGQDRVHLDLRLADADPAALLAAGARLVREPAGEATWWVPVDPEGNEFCAFRRTPSDDRPTTNRGRHRLAFS
ncbi:VOC family protein [Micromonospora sp. NPDC048935]|uniref:VOC family protein n=1 Tax=Micromonospora sp. NPDC048935 TaxID=3364262 RepID=UPI0037160BB2